MTGRPKTNPTDGGLTDMWNPLRARRERGLRRMASVLLAQPDAQHFGYNTSRAAHVSAGVMYPVLAQMLAEGWVTDGWETPPPADRPARRWYRLTDLGRLKLAALIGPEIDKTEYPNGR